MRMATRAHAVKLYTNPGSRGKIGEWALAELGVEYETVLLDMRAGDHKKPDYLKINPFGKVPALQDGELSLFESGAILLHLYAKHGNLSQEQLSKAYQWTLFANSTLVEAFMKSSQATDTMLRPIEKKLGASEYLEGAGFSACDIAVGSYLLYLPLFFPDRFEKGRFAKEYPQCWRYMLKLTERPACPDPYKQGMEQAKAAMGEQSGNIFSKLFKS